MSSCRFLMPFLLTLGFYISLSDLCLLYLTAFTEIAFYKCSLQQIIKLSNAVYVWVYPIILISNSILSLYVMKTCKIFDVKPIIGISFIFGAFWWFYLWLLTGPILPL
jgi:hypothetical protein